MLLSARYLFGVFSIKIELAYFSRDVLNEYEGTSLPVVERWETAPRRTL